MNEIYFFGLGFSGQLGFGNEENQYLPKLNLFFQGKNIVQIACGYHHTCKYFIYLLF